MIVFKDLAFCTDAEIYAMSKALNEMCEASKLSLGEAAAGIEYAVKIMAMDPDAAAPESAQTAPLPLTQRCRVCGKRYSGKGEAKACERRHRRPWG